MKKSNCLKFFLLRYAPNAMKNEFINLGIVLFDPAAQRDGFCDVRFTNWRRVRSFDKEADIVLLRAIASDIGKHLRDPSRRAHFLQMMEDSFSDLIRLSPRQACISKNPLNTLESLARQYLGDSIVDPRGVIAGQQMHL
jgi:hypothetical protein